MTKFKSCPMLTGKQEYKALMRGQGDAVMPVLRECLREHCAAYVANGHKCNHYHTIVIIESEDSE